MSRSSNSTQPFDSSPQPPYYSENGDYRYYADVDPRSLGSPGKMSATATRQQGYAGGREQQAASRDGFQFTGRQMRPENGGMVLANGSHAVGLDPRPYDTTSSGSEKQIGAMRAKQQVLDKWRLDQRNPVYGTEEGTVSPIKPYNPVQGGGTPPRPRQPATPPRSSEPLPAVDVVGELFNFTQPANLAPKPAPGAPPPPELPAWNSQRPFLSGRYLWESAGAAPRPEDFDKASLGHFKRQTQDNLVVDDLLNTFLGVDGTYIKARLVKRAEGTHITYSLDCPADASVRDMANQMLPLSEYAVVIERFVETRSAFQWGLVCHALAGAMRELLEDWRLMVTQLEHQHLLGRLNLPVLWYHCQKPLTSLQLVASLAGEAAARKLRGAALLNLLHQRAAAVTGDEQAMVLVQKLLHAATRPYFSMLELWLCQGVLNDPYAEFMVEEEKSVGYDTVTSLNDSAYWEERYKLRLSTPGGFFAGAEPLPDMPAFLEPCKNVILTTGKYLNIIRECGREVVRPLPADVHIVYDQEQGYLRNIHEANRAASAAMLSLMQKDLGLPAVLLALKHYFMLDRGDLLLSFLDTAEDEMAKPLQQGSLPRLQTLLDLAVRTSSGVAEPKGEELFCTIDTRRLQPMLHALKEGNPSGRRFKPQHPLTPPKLRRGSGAASLAASTTSTPDEDGYLLAAQVGREVFMLGFKVGWPMNVVVNVHAMNTYQLIFRHLFELKCVERELNKVWKIYQRARRVSRESDLSLKRAYGLCQRMMHFFHQYLLHVTFEVLEPLWLTLQKGVQSATSLDEIIDHHKRFLHHCLQGTVLKSKMVRNLNQLKALVYEFARQSELLEVDAEYLEPEPLDRYGKAKTETRKRQERAEAMSDRIHEVLGDGAFSERVKGLDEQFCSSLCNFIAGLGEVYKASSAKPDTNKEECESLLNLIARLDFNDFFAQNRSQAGSLLGPLPRLRPR